MHLSVPSFRHLLSCCQLGISAFVGEISSAVITTVFNMLLLNLAGNIGVAAYGVVANYSIVAVSVFNGLAQEHNRFSVKVTVPETAKMSIKSYATAS